MIKSTSIKINIEELEKLYNSSSSKRKEFFYSKLAIIELCGWVEQSMDNIIEKCCNRNLKKQDSREKMKEVIQRTYGFEYDNHFKRMLVHIVGLKGVESLETKIDSLKLQRLKSTLGMLKKPRDVQAHTHVTGVLTSIDSPSVTMAKLQFLHEGLVELDITLKKIKY